MYVYAFCLVYTLYGDGCYEIRRSLGVAGILSANMLNRNKIIRLNWATSL